LFVFDIILTLLFNQLHCAVKARDRPNERRREIVLGGRVRGKPNVVGRHNDILKSGLHSLFFLASHYTLEN